ncbi:MAG: glycoside hydrolase family 15 protein [Dehalococcoidia bacterium]|nr:glycoside hydrolase family 15 protein [Dehalococcoidia bacterium]
MANDGYKPIADYGAIGNLRSVALIGRDGSIDWCCYPHMDRASVFGALLDARKGGRFSVSAAAYDTGKQAYIEDSNVLQTSFQKGAGELTVTDVMPVSGDIFGSGNSASAAEIHRVLECKGERCEVVMEWSPRFDYARSPCRICRKNGGWIATDGKHRLSLCGLADVSVTQDEYGPTVQARFEMCEGERRVLVTRWDTEDTGCDPDRSMALLRDNTRIWQEWAHSEGAVHNEDWAGEWLPAAIRSELVFKMLAHGDTGSVAAAPTTSLPETIGGVRNWDYRYIWLRDSSLTVQALVSMGHKAEAIDLLNFLERVSAARFEQGKELQIMYGLHGEADLEEHELKHLDGYRQSRPVRIGNSAASQFQLETFGEIMNTSYELLRRGEILGEDIMSFLSQLAGYVSEVWTRPDHGIWEMQGPPRHFTYSKLMAWLALERAIELSQEFGLQGDIYTWRRERNIIRGEVLKHGYNEKVGAFVQSFDSTDLDASNLRIPLLEFLPMDDPRIQGTIDRTMAELTDNGLVYRYLNDDGLPGREGAFGICSFWLVDVLALSGRVDEAWDVFHGVVEKANHLGLFPEEFDAKTGEHLGNFPQAYTHIGLINSLLYLAYAEGREIPEYAPVGTPTHRRVRERRKA